MYFVLSVGMILPCYSMQSDLTGDNQPIIAPAPSLSTWQQYKQFIRQNVGFAIGTTIAIAAVAGFVCDLGSAITAPEEVSMATALPIMSSIPQDTERCTFRKLRVCDYLFINNCEQCEEFVSQDGAFTLLQCSAEPDGQWGYFGVGSIVSRGMMLGTFGVAWLRHLIR